MDEFLHTLSIPLINEFIKYGIIIKREQLTIEYLNDENDSRVCVKYLNSDISMITISSAIHESVILKKKVENYIRSASYNINQILLFLIHLEHHNGRN